MNRSRMSFRSLRWSALNKAHPPRCEVEPRQRQSHATAGRGRPRLIQMVALVVAALLASLSMSPVIAEEPAASSPRDRKSVV